MSWNAKKEENRRLKKLYKETGMKWFGLGPGAYHNSRRNDVLTRCYPYSTNHDNVKKWWRKHSNRRFRRNEKDILNRSLHKKSFDLWWKLY